ncbi:hypothetical protein WA026_010224 [Henosepilachna vigintioctopunctata]|uniref:HMG box domain-containing protein n=1 Tax=Henosepilachna vigintioctopunctata TaxID=420089 RepID=A0AAW1UBG3_9CUCU
MENKGNSTVTGTQDEANNLLQNGILVETDSGLLCVPLNESLLSDWNLSVEALHSVASQLILQEDNKIGFSSNARERIHLRTYNFNFDSDGFSSECSDISSSSGQANQPIFTLTSGSLPSEPKLSLKPNCHEEDAEINTSYKPTTISSRGLLRNPTNMITKHEQISLVSMHSSSDVSVNSNISDSDTSVANFSSPSVIIPFCTNKVTSPINAEAKNTLPLKRRGGWPKGRKRKPELLNLPPKAPATGYNLYLNEQRKLYKESNLAFHEITKIIGNRWSSLTLNDKKPYLAKAEEDKKRYREELHKYRQSDAYRAYLNKKRKNRLQNNILSESDMDATDEIDEEDNEELYCRTCDQWFHNLHNKKEHLQGRQHTQSVAGDMKKELGNNVNFDPYSGEINDQKHDRTVHESGSVSDSINHLVSIVAKREKEIKSLKCRLEESQLSQRALWQQLCSLTERESKLNKDLQLLKMKEQAIENIVFQLSKVPSFVTEASSHISDVNDELSEEN